ncbi:MAG TPA: chemotaxis protein CheD [Myxococcota bacterium]|nr:chemotaxis protein CheD [Myxococcota bacterium]HRY95218.1 chemotaxis protein CheD [Myxococcota bacterium]HSA22336.1 chemotaxis protein CheD [Myxococcota bacterium]
MLPATDRSGQILHVPLGLERVARGAVILEAKVDSGYALAALVPGRRCGGLVHLPAQALENLVEPRAMDTRLGRFFQVIALCGGLKDCRCGLFGGADPGRLTTVRRTRTPALSALGRVREALHKLDIDLQRAQVGRGPGWLVRIDLENDVLEASELETCPPNATRPAPEVAGSPPRYVMVNMGMMSVERGPTVLAAILGSCVGIFLYDQEANAGGLAHAMLPCNPGGDALPSRFADSAVHALIAALERLGARPDRLRAKLFGGAQVLAYGDDHFHNHIGARNVQTAASALAQAGIPLVEQDVGGSQGRKLWADLADFRTRVQLLGEGGGP